MPNLYGDTVAYKSIRLNTQLVSFSKTHYPIATDLNLNLIKMIAKLKLNSVLHFDFGCFQCFSSVGGLQSQTVFVN